MEGDCPNFNKRNLPLTTHIRKQKEESPAWKGSDEKQLKRIERKMLLTQGLLEACSYKLVVDISHARLNSATLVVSLC